MNEELYSAIATLKSATWGTRPLQQGDRVRIKQGYEGAGDVYYYIGKHACSEGKVLVEDSRDQYAFLADAIEPYPYTREERIERAIEDLYATVEGEYCEPSDDFHAALFAILDAGV